MCTDCLPNTPIVTGPLPGGPPCGTCDPRLCPNGLTDASCISYLGPELSCIGAPNTDHLDLILQRIDQRLCHVGDPIVIGNTFCIGQVSGVSDFISKISERFCNLHSAYNIFTATTFPAKIAEVNQTIDTLSHPGITACPDLGLLPADTIKQTLAKLAGKICILQHVSLNLSDVNWQQCINDATVPVSLQQGFDLLIDQICLLRGLIQTGNGGGTLPTFDNTGTCLPGGGATDSLESTIVKIRSMLCTTPSFNPSLIPSGCLQLSPADTLDQVLTKISGNVTTLTQDAIKSVNPSQFTISPVDPANPCAGKQLSLNTQIQDRHVAANSADNSPGTLSDKLAAGANISLDANSVSGKIIISSTGGLSSNDAFKLKTDASDPAPGYLSAKIQGVSNTLSTIVASSVAGKVALENTLDVTELAQAILDIFETDGELKNRLCMLISSCPSPCAPPSNVEAIAIN